MAIKIKSLIILFASSFVILMAGCTSSTAAAVVPAGQLAQQPSQVQSQQPSNQVANTATSTGSGNPAVDNSAVTKSTAAPVNRVDVIYFHVNQRCVTCLCFEEHVNRVIEKYFADAIASGKLTYKVLNAQVPENAGIAKKYGVVGSQLFINTITKGVDNIEDIAEIWNWNCRNNPNAFELKVKNAIQTRLGGQG